MTWFWINGEVTAADSARVSALDHGFTVGDGIFETCKVVNGVPFALTRHLRRLHHSAAALELVVPLSDADLRDACDVAIGAATDAGEEVGRLRLTVTGGPGPLGSGRGDVAPTVVLAVSPASPWPAVTSVVTVPWTRNERSALAGVKSMSYAENVKALSVAHRAGASEAIFANTVGALCEGTGSNIFVVMEGRLLTPTLLSGCLAGVTRELIIELVDVVETDALRLGDLRSVEEAFLTSSTRDVHPISAIDGSDLPGLCPGPLTSQAAEALAALESRTLDP